MLPPRNVTNLVLQNSYILILAIGMVLVIIAGHIDLSVGSVAAFIGAFAAVLIRRRGLPWCAGDPARARASVPCRCLAGLLDRLCRHPGVHRDPGGHADLPRPDPDRSASPTLGPVPEATSRRSATASCPEFGPNTGYNNLTLMLGFAAVAIVVLRRSGPQRQRSSAHEVPRNLGHSCSSSSLIAGRPHGHDALRLGQLHGACRSCLIILAVLVLVYGFIRTGPSSAVTSTRSAATCTAAELSGVKPRRSTSCCSSTWACSPALAGMIFSARSTPPARRPASASSSTPSRPSFIGGAAVTGGVGTVDRRDHRWSGHGRAEQRHVAPRRRQRLQQVIKGLVLLIAVAFDVYNKTQGKKSITGMLMKNFRPQQRNQGGRNQRRQRGHLQGNLIPSPFPPTLTPTPPTESEPRNANDW